MVMKTNGRKSKRRTLGRAVDGGLSRLRKQPLLISPLPAEAELIRSNNGSNPDAGILRQGTDALRLPSALAEAGETDSEGSPGWMPGPVVITVATAAVIFIAIITWFVSQMPAK